MEATQILDIVTAVLFIWALVKLGDIAQNTDAMRRDISRLVRSVESRNGPATPTIHGEEEGRPAQKIYEAVNRMQRGFAIVVLVFIAYIVWNAIK